MYVTRITYCNFVFLAVAATNTATGDDDDIRNSTTTNDDILLSLRNIHDVFKKQMQGLSSDVKWLKSRVLPKRIQRQQGRQNLALIVPGENITTFRYHDLGVSQMAGLGKILEKLNEIELEVDNVSDPIVYQKLQEMREILDSLAGNTGAARKCGRNNHYGHEGNKYLVVFPQFKYGNATVTQLICMITTRQDITVSIQSPFPGVSRTIGVSAEHGAIVSLPPGIMQRGNAVELKGVLVESDSVFSLFGYNQRGSIKGEAYAAIPTKYLGTSYFIVGYTHGFVSIVALHDDTRVNITFDSGYLPEPYSGKTYKTGDTLTVYLSKLSSFQLKGNDYLIAADVKSDKEIAVVSGSSCYAIAQGTSSSYCNQLMSYVPPTNRLGYTFIVPHIPRANDTYIFPFSRYTHSNVRVNIQGSGYNSSTTFRGHTLYMPSSKIPYIIKTSHPSIILQYTTYYNAPTYPSQILIPAVTQYSNHYKFITPSNQPYDNYAVVIIRSENIRGLRFDGGKIYKMASDIKTVTDTDALYNVISLNITAGQHRVDHVDDDVVFGLILYGFDTDQSYGMPVGLDLGKKSDCPLS